MMSSDLLLLARVVDAGAVDQPPRLVGLEALERVDVQARERVRRSSSATSSISTPPSVVSMKSGFFSPRSNVTER